MKLYYLSLFSTVLAMGAAASPSADDRSDALLRHRPSGTFRVIDASRQHNRHLQSQNYTTVHNHPCFRDLQGMTQAMFDLQNEYSHLVSISDIGDSYLKSIDDNDGHDIYVMEITASPNSTTSSQVFMVGGQHAREMAPPELLMRYAEQLVQGYDRDADITWILDTTQVNIVLYVNPDGREVAETQHDALWWWWWGGYIRKNVNPGNVRCIFESYGVDLNRNYDWMWGGEGGASSAPCDEMYHGVEPESEPEVRAVVDYAKSIFPEGQRKVDPVKEMDVPYGENVTGLFVDVHAYGGLTLFPWTFEDKMSPDHESLEALGRKASYFNGNILWSAGQPDFLYAAAGVAHDYMYGNLGVASLGLELGDAFYQDCDTFEESVLVDNLNTLVYVTKLAKKPNAMSKGPDILDFTVTESNGEVTVRVDASDSELVNIKGYDQFSSGNQTVTKIELYLDVLPDDYENDETKYYLLRPTSEKSSDRVTAETNFSIAGLSTGRHALYAVATDSDGYTGPVSSVFFQVEKDARSPFKPSTMLRVQPQNDEALKVTVTIDVHERGKLVNKSGNLRRG